MENKIIKNFAAIGLSLLDTLFFFIIFHLFTLIEILDCKVSADYVEYLKETLIAHPYSAMLLIVCWIVGFWCVIKVVSVYKKLVFPKTRQLIKSDNLRFMELTQKLGKRTGLLFWAMYVSLLIILYLSLIYRLLIELDLMMWVWLAPLFYTLPYVFCNILLSFSLYIFNHKKAYNSGAANLYHFHDYDTLGSAGPGRGYHSMNGKECIYVNLLKIETDNPNNSLLVDKNTEPVLYGKYSIFCIQDAVFWHAVLINEEFYCFDIRELANKMNLSSSLQNEVTTIIGNKRVWLQNFFQRLEDSAFFFDIENCFK